MEGPAIGETVMFSAVLTGIGRLLEAWVEFASALVVSAGPLVVDHLWQATLFVGALGLLLAVLTSAPARLRCYLCLLAAAKFWIPSALVLTFVAPALPASLRRLPEALGPWLDFGAVLTLGGRWLGLMGDAAAGTGALELSSRTWLVLALLWAAVSVWLLTSWVLRLLHLRNLLVRGRQVVDGPEWWALQRARRLLGAGGAWGGAPRWLRAPLRNWLRHAASRRVELVLSDQVSEPGAWGVLRPRVVLPASMAGHLSREELEAVLLHELIHIRRWDNLIARSLMLLRCLLWFHPLVWWLDRRCLVERELACDQRVVALTGSPQAYLRGLAKVVRFGGGWRLPQLTTAGASSATGADLRQRIALLRRGEGENASRLRSWLRSSLHWGAVTAGTVLLLGSSLFSGPLCAVDAPARILSRTAAQVFSSSGAFPGGPAVSGAASESTLDGCPQSHHQAGAVKYCESASER
ncbi:MAG: M56 family metallopeptidase [Acidobacteriota bacterium]|nr:M56 family metallopeptidase [Acidobacteriota bacterium]